MTIICSGSLAIDRLFNFPGSFSDSIIADKIEVMNICFVVDNATSAFGGTAGNITYNLNLLEEKPILVASLGGDPGGKSYLNRLQGLGLPLDGVKAHQNQMTASCTITTDKNKNQINFFHPGAMLLSSGFNPSSLPRPYNQHLAIVSPGSPEEMKSLCQAYQESGLSFIFDPGQQISVFTGAELTGMINGSKIFICNEYEYELFKEISDLDTNGILGYTEAIIITRGSAGSDLIVPSRGSQHIAAVPARKEANPTGAGDAYRAGLLKALCKKRPEHLITACRLGATVAAFCVETEGGPQDHSFTLAKVAGRHAAFFKEQLTL